MAVTDVARRAVVRCVGLDLEGFPRGHAPPAGLVDDHPGCDA